jgi:hypothetical protein
VEPLSAKGKSEPVPAYRLLEVTAVGPAARRLGTPFTGREAELALLERELEAVVSEGECRPVTIVGEPGVGKSRLVAEFVERVDGRARVVRGTCLSYGEGITYWAIGQIVRELARVTDGHSPGEARALIESLVAGLPNGTAVATNVAQLLGLADGAATADETAAAIRDVLAAGAREEPLVVVDDIQWAEPMLLDLLASLPDRLAEAPIMLLCLARPELPEHRPDWQATVHLEPFVGCAAPGRGRHALLHSAHRSLGLCGQHPEAAGGRRRRRRQRSRLHAFSVKRVGDESAASIVPMPEGGQAAAILVPMPEGGPPSAGQS